MMVDSLLYWQLVMEDKMGKAKYRIVISRHDIEPSKYSLGYLEENEAINKFIAECKSPQNAWNDLTLERIDQEEISTFIMSN